jgi:hypothetical protein
MFLRRTGKSQTAVAVQEDGEQGVFVERRSKPRGADARKLFKVIPGKIAVPVPNITTYIVKRYAHNGHIRLPNSSGGRAFTKALRDKGITVQ